MPSRESFAGAAVKKRNYLTWGVQPVTQTFGIVQLVKLSFLLPQPVPISKRVIKSTLDTLQFSATLPVVKIKNMNYTYLLLNAIALVIAVWGWRRMSETEDVLSLPASILGSIVSIFMFGIGLVAPVGTPSITDSVPFQIEKTEYRVIVKTGVGEYQWTDAETVAKIAQIEKVTLTKKRNTWGFDVEKPVATLTFKDGTKK